MRKYSHESKELNALLGRKVRVMLFDDTVLEGVLTRSLYRYERYEVAGHSFRKTHVKIIEVIR